MRLKDSSVPRAALSAGIVLAAMSATASAGAAPTMPPTVTPVRSSDGSSIEIPTKPDAALYQGKSAESSTDIHYDPQTHEVTVRLRVQDPHGYFIPNIRRDNFVVTENGIRQEPAAVEVEHPPVTLGVLLESGGRYPSLNESMALAEQSAASQLVREMEPEDKIAVWRYGDTLTPVADFSDSRETLRRAIRTLSTPPFSELNYYDALIASIRALQSAPGRKALLLVTSGIDTFSRANFEDVLRTAREMGVAIYAVNLGTVAHREAALASISPPYAKLNWKRANAQLMELTQAAQGRTYSPDSTIDLSAIYDDFIENLRVRYVLTYRSHADTTSNAPRTVRIILVNAKTGGPLKIQDEDKHTILVPGIVEGRYLPRIDAVARLGQSKASFP